MVTKYSVLSAALLLPSLLVVACGNGDGKKSAGKSGEIGTAQLFVQEVPSDVRCIRITAASGPRSRTDAFDVTPAESAVLTMDALPSGSVTFTGDAFAVACADINVSTRPTWLSDPVTADIQPGAVTEVTVVMRQVGGARIGVDFRDGGVATGGSGGTGNGGTGNGGSAGSGNAGTGNGGTGNGGSAGSGNAGTGNGGSAGSGNGGSGTLGTWDQSTWDNATWQ